MAIGPETNARLDALDRRIARIEKWIDRLEDGLWELQKKEWKHPRFFNDAEDEAPNGFARLFGSPTAQRDRRR